MNVERETAHGELSQLVRSAQAGDRLAFSQIVVRFQNMAFAGAYALLNDPHAAQDAAQEAFLEAYRNLSNLRNPAAFPGWFRRIVLGRSHRELRQRPPSIEPLEKMGPYVGDLHDLSSRDPAAQLEQLQLSDELERALSTLPEAQRLVVLLYHIEGYSYREIANFLEVPLSTVKKRLFDARRKLKERMLHMVQDQLRLTKPSQDLSFAQQVDFFLAIRAEDLAAIQRLVGENPALLTAKTEWKMALGLHYWPLGFTALHLAAGMGSTEILAFLLTQQNSSAPANQDKMTPLHVATLMGQTDAVQLLLDHETDPNARSPIGQTALHLAAIRGKEEIAKLLLHNNGDPSIKDDQGRTAMDWAAIQMNGALVDLLSKQGLPIPATFTPAVMAQKATPTEQLAAPPLALLGAILEHNGTIRVPSEEVSKRPAVQWDSLAEQPDPSILRTGLKFIDLLAPLARGGQNGIFTALSGVGLVVLIGQIIHSMRNYPTRQRQSCTVWLLQESNLLRAEEQKLNWRELGIEQEIVYVASRPGATEAAQQQTIETGLRIANEFQQNGWEVLLLVDSQLATKATVLSQLRTTAAVTAAAAVTTLIHGHHTPGALPAAHAELDTVLAFDYIRASNRLYPALDAERSHSTLFDRGLASPHHHRVASAVKRLLQRYGELRAPMEQYQLTTGDLWYIEDDPNLDADIKRARRLDRFLTQPFYGAEPWTGIAGQLITVEETIAGCQSILDGNCDELPEAAFLYVGNMAEVTEKAATLA